MSDSKFKDYLCSDELGDCTATDPADKKAQWIHACSWKEERRGSKSSAWQGGSSPRAIPCQSGHFEVCRIKPSAMFFTQKVLAELASEAGGGDRLVKCEGGQYYRVCYSSHSSLDELVEFVRYFRPKRIVPCVVPSPRGAHKTSMIEVSQDIIVDIACLLGGFAKVFPKVRP